MHVYVDLKYISVDVYTQFIFAPVVFSLFLYCLTQDMK